MYDAAIILCNISSFSVTNERSIHWTIPMGYETGKTLMIGDTLGDEKAASSNDVSFYPIVTRKENESWKIFCSEAFDEFISGRYSGEYQKKFTDRFYDGFKIVE